VPIIAKIERPEAIKNIDEIINESDGIMIARGDLGLEYPVEDVPLLQKELIRKCNAAGTPVITATQMLESMINSPRPTRAEASDVSNAVFDGSDVLMLSGETSVGTYPVDALNNMINIILKTENQIYNIPYGDRLYTNLKTDISDAISHASTVIAEQINASAIAAITSSSNTVRNIARFRPRIPIVGITNDRSIMRRLNLFWGTIPICLETITKFDDFYNYFISNKDKFQFIDENSFIVFVSGLNNPVSENLIKVYQL